MTRLFGTDGVRGVANSELTPELAFKLGEAAGHFLGDKGRGRILIGRDTRKSGDMLEAALVAGVCAGGADALLCGIVPTPAIALLTRELACDGGVVISASHNPSHYNGIKFFSRDGFKLPDELEDEIEAFVFAEEREYIRPTGAGIGRIENVLDASDRYVSHAIASLEGVRLDGMKIALDCGHGASALTSPAAFEALGAEVIAINCDWNGVDINDNCGSTHPEMVAAVVREHGADLGVAHDGDADRVIAVDDQGEEVDGDAIMAICGARMKELGTLSGGTIVSTVMCNLGFEIAMRELGISVIKTKVGDRYVLEQMLTMEASLGGEQSGHIIFLEHNTTGDGLVTALQLARVARETGKPVSELRKVMTRFPQVLVNVHVADKARLATSAAITSAIHAEEKLLGDSGRVLVRASGTEALVRVMAEAADEPTAQAVVDRLVEVVKSELG